MLKYAQIINQETKKCNVALGDDNKFYQSIGMTEMEVEQAYNGDWYIKGYVPVISQEELNLKEAIVAKNELQEIAIKYIMMCIADDNVVEIKNKYQTKLRSISDGAALKVPELFSHWSGNSKEYVKDDKVLYNDVLYKVLQNHTSQEGWTPTSAPSLFAKVLTSEGEILDWEQPSSTNPYMKGDKVRYNGKVYESLIDNNVWAPDAYPLGWKEIEEA